MADHKLNPKLNPRPGDVLGYPRGAVRCVWAIDGENVTWGDDLEPDREEWGPVVCTLATWRRWAEQERIEVLSVEGVVVHL